MNKRFTIIGLALMIFGLLTSMPAVHSQSGNEAGSGLSISPTSTPLTIEPGGTDEIRLNVRNVTGGDIVAKAFVNDFESNNETGEPSIIVDESQTSPHSIKPFLGNVDDIKLSKGQDKTVKVSVKVPEGAAPGAYYGIVRYAAVPAGGDAPNPGQVSLTASVGSIVLIEVPGNITEQIQVKDVLVYLKNVAGTFFTAKPEEVGIRIVNQGNSFSRPFGTVTVENPFGNQVHSYELNGTTPRGTVLPNSTRVFRDQISGVSMPGRYVVTANVSFGNGGEVLTIRDSFWYLPMWFLGLVILLIAILSGAVYLISRKLRSRTLRRR